MGQLGTKHVRKLVVWLKRPNSVGWRVDLLNVVKTIPNADVLNNIACVEDVSSGGRHFDLDVLAISRVANYFETHLFRTMGDLIGIQLESED